MKEKLIIRNFGPIKEVELELGKFNILIGEQATGKSTIAKVLAVCKYFSYINNFDYFEENGSAFSWGLINWGLEDSVKHDTYIYYNCPHYSLEGKALKRSFDLSVFNNIDFDIEIQLTPVSESFKNLISELKKINKNKNVYSLSNTPVTFFQNNVASVMDNPFYLSAERGLQSIFSLGRQSIKNISDSLFNLLAKIDGILRSFKKDVKIEPLKISYKNENGKSLIKSPRHKYINLSNAATGYQSTIPIVLLIKHYINIRKKKKTFIIEEPEQNLFPTAQYELIKFFSENLANTNGFLITTHSPYILSSLNNLMYAHNVGNKNKGGDKEAVAKVIEEKYWINPNEVSAFILKYDNKKKGTVHEDIKDSEGLLRVQKIDEISSILNKEFNQVMNIELGIND